MPQTLSRNWWWGFVPYALVSALHVIVNHQETALATPTKLALMPLLAIAVLWGLRGVDWGPATTLVLVAIFFSWLGDGAGPFFPFFDDELPMMLLCFGIAHIAYIVLFMRHLSLRKMPAWSMIYLAWYVVLLWIMAPHIGVLLPGVVIYGLVLGLTAASATRCNPVIAVGAAFFLASDTALAFRIFLPDAVPQLFTDSVMTTYTIGQGLIALGVVIALRRRHESIEKLLT